MSELKNFGQAMNDYIPAHRKELYFQIIDSHHDLHAVALRMHFLEEHFPPWKLDRALKWVIKNGFTGKNFVEWFANDCKSSDLEMHRRLLSVLDQEEFHNVHVIAGKNFKV